MPVSPSLALVEPPQQLWRAERMPLRFSRTNAVNAVLDRSGNCFDVAGDSVLYAATDQEGASTLRTAWKQVPAQPLSAIT